MFDATPAAAQSGYLPVYIPIGPVRAYDSRVAGGRINSGRTQRLAGGFNPEDFAQCFNLTVAQTSGSGWLAVYPGDESWPGNSSINWTNSGQTIANNAYTRIDLDDGGIFVRCGGGSSSTHYVLDLVAALTLIDFGTFSTSALRELAGDTAAILRARYERKLVRE